MPVLSTNYTTLMLYRGVPVNIVPVSVVSGVGPYNFSISPALPAGLTMDPATGRITGTPAANVILQNFTVTVNDSA